MDETIPSEGDWSVCPPERKANKEAGKLSQARRICSTVGLKWQSSGSCSEFVNDKAGVFGRAVTCSSEEIYRFDAKFTPPAPGGHVKNGKSIVKHDHAPAIKPKLPGESTGKQVDVPSSTPMHPGSGEPLMQLRQRIACDICLGKLKDCQGYIPSKKMLSPVRPPPETPNGRYFVCHASERELYTRDDDFKVTMDETIPSEGDWSVCPKERNANKETGKLPQARRMCTTVGLSWQSFSSCGDFVNDKAGVFGRAVTCSAEGIYRFD